MVKVTRSVGFMANSRRRIGSAQHGPAAKHDISILLEHDIRILPLHGKSALIYIMSIKTSAAPTANEQRRRPTTQRYSTFPSTLIDCPVILRAAGEARKSAVAAMSCIVTMRRNEIFFR